MNKYAPQIIRTNPMLEFAEGGRMGEKINWVNGRV
jgi:hypothetical protein